MYQVEIDALNIMPDRNQESCRLAPSIVKGIESGLYTTTQIKLLCAQKLRVLESVAIEWEGSHKEFK